MVFIPFLKVRYSLETLKTKKFFMDESTNKKTSHAKVDVIIIGGGASGLAAGKEISKAGKKVCVLEARNRLGGRIHTLNVPGFSTHIEAGAEFVHGDMPVTKSLLKEGGIEFNSIEGCLLYTSDAADE